MHIQYGGANTSTHDNRHDKLIEAEWRIYESAN